MYSYPLPYLSFLAHFHGNHDYFECHEVLEEHWKEATDQSKDAVWVGLIQIAVSQYHHRRGNFAGAKKMMAGASTILGNRLKDLEELCIDGEALHRLVNSYVENIEKGEQYAPMALPFLNNSIEKEYTHFQQYCMPDLQPDTISFLIDKHRLRNRSEVIASRQEALLLRRKAREAAASSTKLI